MPRFRSCMVGLTYVEAQIIVRCSVCVVCKTGLVMFEAVFVTTVGVHARLIVPVLVNVPISMITARHRNGALKSMHVRAGCLSWTRTYSMQRSCESTATVFVCERNSRNTFRTARSPFGWAIEGAIEGVGIGWSGENGTSPSGAYWNKVRSSHIHALNPNLRSRAEIS